MTDVREDALPTPDIRPRVRQLTGRPYLYHSYAHDRVTGRNVAGCQHRHRSERTAMECAKRMVRAALARKEDGDV